MNRKTLAFSCLAWVIGTLYSVPAYALVAIPAQQEIKSSVVVTPYVLVSTTGTFEICAFTFPYQEFMVFDAGPGVWAFAEFVYNTRDGGGFVGRDKHVLVFEGTCDGYDFYEIYPLPFGQALNSPLIRLSKPTENAFAETDNSRPQDQIFGPHWFVSAHGARRIIESLWRNFLTARLG